VNKGYKWIATEIDRLDPETDYERIWKLSTCYYVNDFMMNVLYTTGFPHFILPPYGGETVSRGGYGKLIVNRQKRADDTLGHFWRWFEFGPSNLETQRSVRQVNGIHAGIARGMPGNFAHNEDFVYTMCWIGADMHRLRLRLGLPGYTEKQRIATHRYWQAMSTLFVSELGDITDFPADFDGMVECLTTYEATDWEFSPEGAVACEALIQQFSRRWFPRPLRFLGRVMILALLDEPAHRVHRLPYTRALTRRFMELGLKAVLVAKERILPDPRITTPERHRRRISKRSPNGVAAAGL
jgi:hypothetical protein